MFHNALIWTSDLDKEDWVVKTEAVEPLASSPRGTGILFTQGCLFMLKLLCTFLLSTIILPIQNHQNHRMKPLCRAFPVVVFFFHYKKVLPLCNCGLSFQIPKLSDSIQHPERKTFRRFWLIFPSAAQSMSSQSDGIVQQLSPHKTIQHQKENSFSSHRPKVKKCFSEQSIKI